MPEHVTGFSHPAKESGENFPTVFRLSPVWHRKGTAEASTHKYDWTVGFRGFAGLGFPTGRSASSGVRPMKMWVFLVRRLLLMVPVLIGVVTITFILLNAVPIHERLLACTTPGRGGFPHPGTPAYNSLLAYCGLNLPWYTAYGHYLLNTFTFNWGHTSPNSYMMSVGTPFAKACGATCPETTIIGAWLPYTIELALLSLLFILLFALPVGTYAAVYRNRAADQGARIFSFSGYALPSFLLGSLLIVAVYFALVPGFSTTNCLGTPLYAVYGSWPPASCFLQHFSSGNPPFMNALGATSPTGFPTIDALIYAIQHPGGVPGDPSFYWGLAADSLLRMVLPALVIAYGGAALILRFVRNSMLEVMNLDFVRTARAKGLSERRVVRHHAGRNSLNVTITILGLLFAAFLAGFAVTELVFNLYGVGRLFTYAIQQPYDYATIFASTVLFTMIVVVANVIVDVTYSYLDPRVRLG
jgi:ABC-type dipeptide/oligopeptide/nickel transport system permease component